MDLLRGQIGDRRRSRDCSVLTTGGNNGLADGPGTPVGSANGEPSASANGPLTIVLSAEIRHAYRPGPTWARRWIWKLPHPERKVRIFTSATLIYIPGVDKHVKVIPLRFEGSSPVARNGARNPAQNQRRHRAALCVAIALTWISTLAPPASCRSEDGVDSSVDSSVDFNRDVRPILSDRCFQCHGPNEHDRQAELRLDRATGPEGAYRTLDELPAITPGSLAKSALWQRINADDSEIMPPPDSSNPPLAAGEKEIIRRWIEDGAEYSAFWAFIRPQEPAMPKVKYKRWSRSPIDRFVLRRLELEGLSPSASADRRTLIRRLSLDLTGLPPSRQDLQDFLADTSAGGYGRLVDRLLSRPQFGEHMTRYWLDLVRFADTNGIHHDHYREMTPYRDWVIRAFNDSLPYSEFLKYQLAGDLYPNPTRDQLVATGFNRLHLIIDRGTALPEESFTRNVIDRVTAVSTAFMGLTVQCAVCHDHKYDPVTMRDFYQLFAFFNNLDAAPETGGRSGLDFQRGLQPPYLLLASETQQTKLGELDMQIKTLKTEMRRIEQQAQEGESAPDHDSGAPLKQLQQELERVQGARQALEATIPVAMIMKEKAERRPTHILNRGSYDDPGERVTRNSPSFLPPIRRDGEKTRLDLAEWFVSPEHPLTARVAVNRFWQQLFGVGIVKTSEDFGAQGDWPSHPDLLDHLAVDFIESGWDVKRLIRQIVMSETYRQAAEATVNEFNSDPENRLLSRGSRFRLDAEVIRDQMLMTSGLLNTNLYGKSVKPPQPKGLWQSVSMPSSYPRLYEPDAGDKIFRRSVYTFWKRGMPPPQMTILNAPSREACIARRERTNTPLQALLLWNEPQYLQASRHLARAAISYRPSGDKQRLDFIYETITSRRLDPSEAERLLKMVHDLEAIYRNDVTLAEALCEDAEFDAGVSHVELAAWTILVSTIYNLDITKTRG